MKREDLVAMGISEENIEKIIADYGKATQKANADIAALREKAGKADDLQKKLDDLEAGQLTEIEKANKALEAANKTIADMQKSNAIRDQREAAMTNFKITAEQAKEQEIAKSQDVPGGGAGGGNKDEKTEDVKNAESISFGNAAASKEAQNHYVI